jgi:hypothetical protein
MSEHEEFMPIQVPTINTSSSSSTTKTPTNTPDSIKNTK